MKKEDFMQIVRSKAKETLTEQETNFFTGIGEAVETAFNAESVERNKQIKAITEKLGTVDEGETFSEIIRNLSKAITDLENKTKRSFTSDERFKLKSLLEAKKDDIQRARKGGNPWEIEFRAKRAASALMTTGTVLTGGQAVNNVNVFEDMDITVIEYPKNFILDGINSRQVAKVRPRSATWIRADRQSQRDAVSRYGRRRVDPLDERAIDVLSGRYSEASATQ